MSKRYTSLDAWREDAGARHEDKKLKEGGAIGAYSDQRKTVGTESQWMLDNNIQLSDEAMKNLEAFNAMVCGGDATEGSALGGFGNSGFFANTDKMGNKEFTSFSYAMMDLNTMFADGSITTEEYTEKMNTLFSDAMIDDVEAGGENMFYNFAGDLDYTVENSTPDPDQAAKNTEGFSFSYDDPRPVIMDSSDYTAILKERYPEYQDKENEAYNNFGVGNDVAFDAIDAAYRADPPLISKEDYDAIQNRMRENENMGARLNLTDAYAIKEVLETGDPDMIKEFVNPDKMYDLDTADYAKIDLSVRTADGNVQVDAGREVPDRGMYLSGEQFDALNNMDDDRSVSDIVVDNLTSDYFNPTDGRDPAPMTFEEYTDLLEEYNDTSPQDISYFCNDHPGFSEVHSVVTGINSVGRQIDDAIKKDGVEALTKDGITLDMGYSLGGEANQEWAVSSIEAAAAGNLRDPEDMMSNDYDAELSPDEIALLKAGKAPSQRFEDIKQAAHDVWVGGPDGYGSGEKRKENLKAAGFSDDEIKQIQEIVNHGKDYADNLTIEQFDDMFAEQYGGTLAEKDVAYMDAADKMLSYEGGRDFLAQYNADNPADQISATDAMDMYAGAAEYVNENGGADALENEDSKDNLMSFISQGGEASFTEDRDNRGRNIKVPEKEEPQEENGGPEVG